MKKILYTALLTLSFTACKDKNSDRYIDCDLTEKVAPAAEVDSLRSWLTSQGIEATEHPQGIFYIIENGGDEKRIENCYDVNVTYLATNLRYEFIDRGTETSLGIYTLIDGWELGLSKIGNGGKIKLFIPPSLAYGETGRTPAIGPNEFLIFDITLHSMSKRLTYY